MNEGKLLAEREAGQKAARLLEEIAPFLDRIEADCMRAWRTEAKTTVLREEAWHRVRAIDSLRAELDRAIEGGRVAEAKLAK